MMVGVHVAGVVRLGRAVGMARAHFRLLDITGPLTRLPLRGTDRNIPGLTVRRP
jgi:hypothetical protein